MNLGHRPTMTSWESSRLEGWTVSCFCQGNYFKGKLSKKSNLNPVAPGRGIIQIACVLFRFHLLSILTIILTLHDFLACSLQWGQCYPLPIATWCAVWWWRGRQKHEGSLWRRDWRYKVWICIVIAQEISLWIYLHATSHVDTSNMVAAGTGEVRVGVSQHGLVYF